MIGYEYSHSACERTRPRRKGRRCRFFERKGGYMDQNELKKAILWAEKRARRGERNAE